MVKVKKDISGWVMKEHGVQDSKLTVVKQTDDHISKNGKHYSKWICECECGNKNFEAIGSNIISGNVKSCGCETSTLMSLSKKKHNKYVLNLKDGYGLYGYGICSNSNSIFYFDMSDYHKIKDYCWYEDKNGNTKLLKAFDSKIHKNINMHIFLGYKNYDHIDRNELNNRKFNLRPCTATENCRNKSLPTNNTSGIIGVSFHQEKQKWQAYIYVNYRQVYLGSFPNKKDAIIARLNAEKEYFKEFAPQKYLFEQYGIKYEGCDKNES